MAETLITAIPPQEPATRRVQHRSVSTRFGDGYEMTMGDGINTKGESWIVTYRGTDAEVDPIIEFLDNQGTHKSFLWTPPNETVPKLFRLQDGYEEQPMAAGNKELSFTLNRRYVP